MTPEKQTFEPVVVDQEGITEVDWKSLRAVDVWRLESEVDYFVRLRLVL